MFETLFWLVSVILSMVSLFYVGNVVHKVWQESATLREHVKYGCLGIIVVIILPIEIAILLQKLEWI
jgi:membrane protein DedA with SNARE-associated domain